MENQLGTGYVLEVDLVTNVNENKRGKDANYKVIACLTSNGFSGTTAAQSTQSKCDGFYDSSIPGVLSWSMSAEGVATKLSTSELTTRENFQTIAKLWKDRKRFFARWNNAQGDFVREGIAWISSYEETAPNNETYTFTATFTGSGEPFMEPEATGG